MRCICLPLHFWCVLMCCKMFVFFLLSVCITSIHCVCTCVLLWHLPRRLCPVTELVYFEQSELSPAVPVMHHSSGYILHTLSICSSPVCVCLCVRIRTVKACNCKPHPATLDQVFCLSHQQYPEEKAEAACVCSCACFTGGCVNVWKLMDCILKGVTAWTSKKLI